MSAAPGGTNHDSGYSKLVWVIMVAFATIAGAGTQYLVRANDERYERLNTTVEVRGHRLTAVEVTVENLNKRLDKIDAKLDKIIERMQEE